MKTLSEQVLEWHYLNEVKKVKLTPGGKMTSRDFKKAKAAATVAKAKKEAKKAQPKPKAAPKVDTASEKSRGDWFNQWPQLQKFLRANVHPADRERVQNEIWDKGVDHADAYMKGKLPYRKMPKSGP